LQDRVAPIQPKRDSKLISQEIARVKGDGLFHTEILHSAVRNKCYREKKGEQPGGDGVCNWVVKARDSCGNYGKRKDCEVASARSSASN